MTTSDTATPPNEAQRTLKAGTVAAIDAVGEASRLRRMIFGLLVVVVAVSGFGLAVGLRIWATDALAEAFSDKAERVQSEVSRVLEDALSLGIPFDHPDVVEQGFAYFDRILGDNPELRFLAVTDLDGTLYFYEGTNRERIGGFLENDTLISYSSDEALLLGGTGDRSVPIGDFSVHVGPLFDDGALSARFYVGVDRRIADSYFQTGLFPLVLLVAGLIALAWPLTVFIVDRLWTEPVARLEARFLASGAGRWLIIDSRQEGGEYRSIARTANLVVARLRDRHADAADLASEVQSQSLDPDVGRQAADRWSAFSQTAAPKFEEVKRPQGVVDPPSGSASDRFVTAMALLMGGVPAGSLAVADLGTFLIFSAAILIALVGGIFVGMRWAILPLLAVCLADLVFAGPQGPIVAIPLGGLACGLAASHFVRSVLSGERTLAGGLGQLIAMVIAVPLLTVGLSELRQVAAVGPTTVAGVAAWAMAVIWVLCLALSVSGRKDRRHAA